MAIHLKNIHRVFSVQVRVALVVLVLILVFQDALRGTVGEPLLKFAKEYSGFLLYMACFIFLLCSALLIYIVWWIEWGDRNSQSPISQYVSQLVCDNYYGDVRSRDVYQAIRTAISKFRRQTDEEETSTKQAARVKIAPRREERSHEEFRREVEEVRSPEDTSDGVHRTLYSNGKIEREVSYKAGRLHGPYRTYYEDGTLHQEKNYSDGKMHGLFRAFDETGLLYFEMNYVDGQQDGLTNIYYKTGVLQYKDVYRRGYRVHRNAYSESGELIFSQDYSME